jgi:hypothetical protein
MPLQGAKILIPLPKGTALGQHALGYGLGRGHGVGRLLGGGVILGIGVTVAVGVEVGVAVGVAVGLGVGVPAELGYLSKKVSYCELPLMLTRPSTNACRC